MLRNLQNSYVTVMHTNYMIQISPENKVYKELCSRNCVRMNCTKISFFRFFICIFSIFFLSNLKNFLYS
ncbi:hypothetical protein EDEG_03998 [Edhazardia aedis USNM 41457]|uniref:Uncharacterized protein n=1 Tax=Edhazardia aedis (strain USNM 41457) TaxID=1003232 RepID=J9DFJ2_EDHAE|nr:hypothetical protein EDEG_03998 [Edhazardia aedis USNM 41457]|eukprot:EJW01370.1 hypothetical protein EDEG_03998 [Edhazardia aedis USNM 41457]